MKKTIEVVAAKTHPAEYLLHKYWTRKPHNVISHFLSAFARPGDVMVDPCCGSGVSLREAALLGMSAYGFDVNPVAALIATVTANPPPVERLSEAIDSCLQYFEPMVDKAYSHGKSGTIRYVIHETVVQCECGQEVCMGMAVIDGRIYRCPKCSRRAYFNLESLKRTRVVGVVFDGEHEAVRDAGVLAGQEQLAQSNYHHKTKQYDNPFTENRRILAFGGLHVGKLFTPRNFSLLAALADKIHGIKDKHVREAGLMMLSASAVQCSRLIPYRNNMTTGGPAWSVPGFWVPPIHVETNPLIHFKARYSKFIRGMTELKLRPIKGSVSVSTTSATEGLSSLAKARIKADVVFFDPPYGDSVPFLEFSLIWNSFLKRVPLLDKDISVSDRMPKAQAWASYSEGLSLILAEVSKCLNSSGKLIVTFNNNDMRAWEALLCALQTNAFQCEFVSFQIPPVVSAKAQFSPEGSYISDIYSVFSLGTHGKKYGKSLTPIMEALGRCATSRGGRIPRNLASRVASVAWLEHNVAFELVKDLEGVLDAVFVPEGESLVWKGTHAPTAPKISEVVRSVADDLLAQGPCDWLELYQAVARKTGSIGIPDPGELRKLLDGYVVFQGQRCLAVAAGEETRQLALI